MYFFSGHLFPNISSYEPPGIQQRPLPSFIATFIHCLCCLRNENMKIVIAVLYQTTMLALGMLSYRLNLARPPLPGMTWFLPDVPQKDTVLPWGALGKGSPPVWEHCLRGACFHPTHATTTSSFKEFREPPATEQCSIVKNLQLVYIAHPLLPGPLILL